MGRPTEAECEVFAFVVACPTCKVQRNERCITNRWHLDEGIDTYPRYYPYAYIHAARRKAALAAFHLDRLPSDIEDWPPPLPGVLMVIK
jgi:hypothetical protein